MYVLFRACCDEDDYLYNWTDFILVPLELYIFKTVYLSFNEAQETLRKNAKKRKKQKQQKQQKEKEKKQLKQQDSNNINNANNVNKAQEFAKAAQNTLGVDVSTTDVVIEEIDLAEQQVNLQMIEAVTESMPQIILQSVCMMRSANDSDLAQAGSNGIIASLLSVSNKYAIFDKDTVK